MAAPAGDRAARGATILLVDDEVVVRSVIARMLQAAGYFVVEAADGDEGLQRAAALDAAPALVVSDVVMPKMSGPKLVATLRERWPGLLALMMSGYESEEIDGLARAGSGVGFLQKPFTLAELVARVETLLRGPEAAGEAPG
jgi:two-component system cell cycle sensor histidine kinase/response regulator CckA